ncbi:hypothetical protein IFR05_016713 [Cadophora sp. M221]|nr:hypothetical protein IFR05_016713 [Cadophora sp. M221]
MSSSSKSTQKRSQKPAVSLSKVPSIKEICESLGFQSASIKDTDKFLDTTRAFRKSYQITPGVTTADLLRWNDAAIQCELRNMAELFLKDGDNGDVYWGTKRYWYSSGLQYPDDSDRIVNLLMQLFWKQTRYAFNNLQYGHKQSDVRDGSRDDTTPSSESFSQQRPAPSPSTVPGDMQMSGITWNESSDPQVIVYSETTPTPKSPPGSGNKIPSARSIFDGPDDIDENIRKVHDILSAEDQMDQQHTSARPEPLPSSPNSRKRKQPSSIYQRRSVRNRGPPPRPGVATNEEYEEAFHESSESSEAVEETIEIGDPFDRSSSVEYIPGPPNPPFSRNAAIEISPSGRKPFKAPTAPMMASPKKSKAPLAKPKISQPASASTSSSKTTEKVKATAINRNVPAGKTPAQTSKIVTLTMPSAKAQAKPLGRKVEAKKTSSGETLPSVQNDTRTHQGAESPSVGVGTASRERPSSTGGLALNPLEELRRSGWNIPPSNDIQDTSRTFSPHVSGASDETLEAETDARERRQSPLGQRPSQPYSLIPEDRSFARIQLEESTSNAAPTSISQSIEDLPPPPVTLQQSPSPRQPSNPPSAMPTTTEPPLARPTPTPKPAPTPTPTTLPRSKPQVPLWVITHTPRYTEELWDTGRLSGHSLSTFLDSLSSLTSRPAESIDKIKLTLRTPASDTKITVGREAEHSWGAAMKAFKDKLRAVRGVVEGCLILVEPVWEVDCGVEGEGDGEEDVDF